MKLLTYCNKAESIYDLGTHGVKLCDYTAEECHGFLDAMIGKYVSRLFYWYETDMSDSDSGTRRDNFPINYTNLVIKDKKPFAVLVTTCGMFPKYRLLNIKKGHEEAALGGGYNSLDYDWWIKDKDASDVEALRISSSYVYVYEKTVYQKGKYKSCEREVIGFMPEACVRRDGKIAALSLGEEILEIDGADERIDTSEKIEDEFRSVRLGKLVRLTDEFMESSVYDVTYLDGRDGKIKPFLLKS